MCAMVSFRGTYSFTYHGHGLWEKGVNSSLKCLLLQNALVTKLQMEKEMDYKALGALFHERLSTGGGKEGGKINLTYNRRSTLQQWIY